MPRRAPGCGPLCNTDGDLLAGAFYSDHFAASPENVRAALIRLSAALGGGGLPVDPGACEIVLAEVLNNIAEHAYGAAEAGPIRMTAAVTPDGVTFEVEDRGSDLPARLLVPPAAPQPDASDLEALDEGGYGWFLIHSLTRDLEHRRVEGWNQLRFLIPAA